MAPCYNYSRNLHYRTHSLPESHHYNNHMLQHLPPQEQYHAQDKLHAMAHHQAIKKKVNLKRSQTNACDLVMLPPAAAHHHRAPLTAGVYEAFLPPPNLNSVGLPLTASRTGYHHPHSRHSSRSQSFYMPNTTQSRSSHNLDMLGHLGEHHHQQQLAAAANSGYHQQSVIHSGKGFSQLSCSSGREVGDEQHSEQKYHHQHTSNSPHPQLPFNLYHHRSVPNIPLSTPQQSSLTTPLFVDCSVEYDLGDHPPVPANSEPLLTIHPEYVVKSRSINSSPYSLHQNTSNHIRGSKIKGVSPKTDILKETAALNAVISDKSKSCSGGGNANMIQSSAARRQLHQQQAAARYNLAARRSAAMSAADAAVTKSNTDLVTAAKLEATRKLSVESWDSGIGLMGGSNGVNSAVSNNLGGVNSSAGSTQSWCGSFIAPTATAAAATNVNNSQSCDIITSKNSKMISTSSSIGAMSGQTYSHPITHHPDNLPQYDYHSSKTTAINNNNSFNSNNNINQALHHHNKKFAFTGEYMSYQMAKFYDSLLVHC